MTSVALNVAQTIPVPANDNKHKRCIDVIELLDDSDDDTENGDDNDIEVVSPPPPKKLSTTTESEGEKVEFNSNCAEDGDIEVLYSNTVNANVVFPHRRVDCGVHNFAVEAGKYCDKCYCIVCNIPCRDCKSWDSHCHRQQVSKEESTTTTRSSRSSSSLEQENNPFRDFLQGQRRSTRRGRRENANILQYMEQRFGDYGKGGGNDYTRKDDEVVARMSITEVLAYNLKTSVQLEDTVSKKATHLPMEGDVGSLRLHNSFFVSGIKIGWPFPVILPPQRQMAIHILHGLRNQRHVVLESPTGTGKSAAILCSALAWQRWHAQTKNTQEKEQNVPTIIYCSRTHSQVTQMVDSLKKTPYRPRMTVLGSRDRLCINRDLKQKKGNLSLSCREAKRQTDKERKLAIKNKRLHYDDDNPKSLQALEEERRGGEPLPTRANKPCTCDYYRQLSSAKTAQFAKRQFVLNATKITHSCNKAKAGVKTKAGVHDIEDLVTFGKNPCDDEHLDDDGYDMKRAACPYYLSRALLPHANLVFCPYNYVLDSSIRKSLGIDLEGSVVILDEAHNVEDTLCESGSGEFGELDLCQLVCVLNMYSNSSSYETRPLELLTSREVMPFAEVAHDLLLFVETLVLEMRRYREKFEHNRSGLEKVKEEHKRLSLSDDHSIEVKYQGPTGFGIKGEAIGCGPLLQELGVSPERCATLCEYAASMEMDLVTSSEQDDDTQNNQNDNVGQSVLSSLVTVLSRFELATQSPEHFYMAYVMKANGNMDYATEMPQLEYNARKASKPWRKEPRRIPFVFPRSEQEPEAPLLSCRHKSCHSQGFHGTFCNGDTQRWECRLVLRLLSPGLLMKNIAQECRSVILASGSLAPLPSLCAELNLYGPLDETSQKVNQRQLSVTQKHHFSHHSPSIPKLETMEHKVSSKSQLSQSLQSSSPESSMTPMSISKQACSKNLLYGRLQTTPKPLEANHVINLPKQLLAVSIGHFPDGSPLTVTYSHYKQSAFFPRLGEAIAKVVESVPRGGVLIFFPSYNFLKKCVQCWNPGEYNPFQNNSLYNSPLIWSRLLQSKGQIIVEPTGSSQEKFEEAKEEYKNRIKEDRKCILLAVFRGKMSEGISFNDDNARCVICVGLPYPNSFDRNIKAKQTYNDEQRKIRKNNYLLPGMEWYSQQAYRAIAQALGRCIRHGADYGTVVLMDSRHCDDGAPNNGTCRAHKNLPKWMRHSIRTLSPRSAGGVGHNPILGGYDGLQREMQQFFQLAPKESKLVLDKWDSDLKQAQARCRLEMQNCSFNRETGKWTSNKENVKKEMTLEGGEKKKARIIHKTKYETL